MRHVKSMYNMFKDSDVRSVDFSSWQLRSSQVAEQWGIDGQYEERPLLFMHGPVAPGGGAATDEAPAWTNFPGSLPNRFAFASNPEGVLYGSEFAKTVPRHEEVVAEADLAKKGLIMKKRREAYLRLPSRPQVALPPRAGAQRTRLKDTNVSFTTGSNLIGEYDLTRSDDTLVRYSDPDAVLEKDRWTKGTALEKYDPESKTYNPDWDAELGELPKFISDLQAGLEAAGVPYDVFKAPSTRNDELAGPGDMAGKWGWRMSVCQDPATKVAVFGLRVPGADPSSSSGGSGSGRRKGRKLAEVAALADTSTSARELAEGAAEKALAVEEVSVAQTTLIENFYADEALLQTTALSAPAMKPYPTTPAHALLNTGSTSAAIGSGAGAGGEFEAGRATQNWIFGADYSYADTTVEETRNGVVPQAFFDVFDAVWSPVVGKYHREAVAATAADTDTTQTQPQTAEKTTQNPFSDADKTAFPFSDEDWLCPRETAPMLEEECRAYAEEFSKAYERERQQSQTGEDVRILAENVKHIDGGAGLKNWNEVTGSGGLVCKNG